ncbi:hypothetical protein HK101_008013 [Irineochytrium annulatum]|nr:hypothetical protein HK101_008013 [Irineochytrium annulatum]
MSAVGTWIRTSTCNLPGQFCTSCWGAVDVTSLPSAQIAVSPDASVRGIADHCPCTWTETSRGALASNTATIVNNGIYAYTVTFNGDSMQMTSARSTCVATYNRAGTSPAPPSPSPAPIPSDPTAVAGVWTQTKACESFPGQFCDNCWTALDVTVATSPAGGVVVTPDNSVTLTDHCRCEFAETSLAALANNAATIINNGVWSYNLAFDGNSMTMSSPLDATCQITYTRSAADAQGTPAAGLAVVMGGGKGVAQGDAPMGATMTGMTMASAAADVVTSTAAAAAATTTTKSGAAGRFAFGGVAAWMAVALVNYISL